MKTVFYILMTTMCLTSIKCNNDNPVASNTSKDIIEIISVTPDTLLSADSLTKFTVKVNYSLQSVDSAVLSLGFNSNDPNSFSMIPYVDSTVCKGNGTASLIGLVRPKKWDSDIPFIVYVNMAKAPLPETFTALAYDKKKIFSFK